MTKLNIFIGQYKDEFENELTLRSALNNWRDKQTKEFIKYLLAQIDNEKEIQKKWYRMIRNACLR